MKDPIDHSRSWTTSRLPTERAASLQAKRPSDLALSTASIKVLIDQARESFNEDVIDMDSPIDTSGIMVVCRNDEAHKSMKAQFQQRTLKKVRPLFYPLDNDHCVLS